MLSSWCLHEALCALVLLVSIRVTQSIIIDLCQNRVPDGVDVYRGTFLKGGVYRMFHSTDISIKAVTYDRIMVGPMKYKDYVVKDIYVHHFSSDKVNYAEITHVFDVHQRGCRTIAYELKNGTRTFTNISKMVKALGPLFLSVDIDDNNVHPFISVEPACHNSSIYWKIIGKTGRRNLLGAVHLMRNNHDKFYISPFVGLPNISTSAGGTGAAIYSYSVKIMYKPGDSVITLWIEDEQYYPCEVWMPKVDKGIFRPQNMLEKMVKRKWGNGTVLIRGDTIKIDVSSTEIDNKDIIILDNVNLGEWIYRQYSIVISMLPTYVHVTVVDSKNQCILYDLIGDEYVTHVDVFTHLAFNRRFIVINTKKALGSGFVDIKRAYMHQESTEAVCYYDLNNIEGVQIINLLYSIRIKEPSASVAVGNSNNDGITGLTAPVHGNVKCANTMASLNVDDSNVVTVKDSSINTLSDDVDDSSINTVVDSDVMTPIVSSTNSTLDNNMVPVVDSTNSTLNSNVITSVAGSSDTLDNNVVPVAGSSNTMDSDVMTPIVSSTNSTLVDADINTLDGDLLPLFDSEIYTLIDDLLSRGYNGINTVADSDVMNPGVDSGNSAVADSGDNRIEDDVIVVDDDEMTDDDVILVHDDEMTDDDVILVDDVDDFNLAADNVEDLCTPQGENNEGGSIFEVFYQYFKQLSESDEI